LKNNSNRELEPQTVNSERDISTLEKRGHFYFGLTVENCLWKIVCGAGPGEVASANVTLTAGSALIWENPKSTLQQPRQRKKPSKAI
jgi:hypothetical protein